MQRGDRLFLALAEADAADAPVGRRNQQLAERGIDDGEADMFARPALAVLCGGHAEMLVRALVDPAARAEARAVDGIGDVVPLAQLAAQDLHAPCVGVLPRRDAQHLLEDALQMKAADPQPRCQLGQRWGELGISIDLLADIADDAHFSGDSDFNSSGRQRLQGRKPAAAASAGEEWNSTFSRLGVRAGQEGRQ